MCNAEGLGLSKTMRDFVGTRMHASMSHKGHKGFDKRLNVLVYERHKDDPKNKELFDEYKKRFITNSKLVYKGFSKKSFIPCRSVIRKLWH